MKRFVSLTVVFCMLTLAAVTFRQAAVAQKKGGAKASSGAALYQQHCAKCHGADGKGIESLQPPDLTRANGSDKQYLDAITNGRGMMPPYKGTLSQAQMQALLRHIRSFSAKSKKKA